MKSIAITELSTSGKEYIKLLGMSVMTGESVSATATVRLSIEGKVIETSQIGVGPVDAAIGAIKSLVNETVEINLEEYRLEAVSGGTDALAETFVVISDNDLLRKISKLFLFFKQFFILLFFLLLHFFIFYYFSSFFIYYFFNLFYYF